MQAADRVAILKALPPRFPFLMVDRIVNIQGDESAVGIKNVTVNEPQFLGRFPGNPVFPGVLLIEGMAQTAGAVCVLSQMGGDQPKQVYFLTIDKAKFHKPVVPGDTIEYHVRKIARKKNMWWFRGEAKVAGQMVAQYRARPRMTRELHQCSGLGLDLFERHLHAVPGQVLAQCESRAVVLQGLLVDDCDDVNMLCRLRQRQRIGHGSGRGSAVVPRHGNGVKRRRG